MNVLSSYDAVNSCGTASVVACEYNTNPWEIKIRRHNISVYEIIKEQTVLKNNLLNHEFETRLENKFRYKIVWTIQ